MCQLLAERCGWVVQLKFFHSFRGRFDEWYPTKLSDGRKKDWKFWAGSFELKATELLLTRLGDTLKMIVSLNFPPTPLTCNLSFLSNTKPAHNLKNAPSNDWNMQLNISFCFVLHSTLPKCIHIQKNCTWVNKIKRFWHDFGFFYYWECKKQVFVFFYCKLCSFCFLVLPFCIPFHENYENYYLYNDLMRFSAKSVAVAASRRFGADLRWSDRAGWDMIS